MIILKHHYPVFIFSSHFCKSLSDIERAACRTNPTENHTHNLQAYAATPYG